MNFKNHNTKPSAKMSTLQLSTYGGILFFIIFFMICSNACKGQADTIQDQYYDNGLKKKTVYLFAVNSDDETISYEVWDYYNCDKSFIKDTSYLNYWKKGLRSVVSYSYGIKHGVELYYWDECNLNGSYVVNNKIDYLLKYAGQWYKGKKIARWDWYDEKGTLIASEIYKNKKGILIRAKVDNRWIRRRKLNKIGYVSP